jgi:hypothetical protein
MEGDTAKPPRSETDQLERRILEILFELYPSGGTLPATAPGGPYDAPDPDHPDLWDLVNETGVHPAMERLASDLLIKLEKDQDEWRAIILPDGMRRLKGRGTSYDDLEHLQDVRVELLAQLVETKTAIDERFRSEASRMDGVDGRVKELETVLTAAEQAVGVLHQKVSNFEPRLARETATVERAFYLQVIPLFALAVSAFALVITGTQSTQGAGSFAITSGADFVNALAGAAARLIPLAALFIVLVGGTLFATEWLRSRATRK